MSHRKPKYEWLVDYGEQEMTATKPDFHHLLLSGREFTISFQNQKDSPNSLVPGSKNILFTPTTNYPESKKIDLFTPFKAQVKDGLRSHPPTYREPIKLNQTIPFTFMLNLLLETPDAFSCTLIICAKVPQAPPTHIFEGAFHSLYYYFHSIIFLS